MEINHSPSWAEKVTRYCVSSCKGLLEIASNLVGRMKETGEVLVESVIERVEPYYQEI